MNILITGGAGYLGSVLTTFLLNWYQHSVTVLDTFWHRVPSLAHVAERTALRIVSADVRDERRLRELLDDADAVVHLAAIVGAAACDRDPREVEEVNVGATVLLVKLLQARHPHIPLIFPCTNSGYGRGGERPCTEDDPMTPLSLYGRTKVAAETAVLSYARGISLRFATLYGASSRMRLDLLVNDFVYRAAWGQSRDFSLFEPEYRRCVLHVFDAARAVELALRLKNQKHIYGRAFNVGAENVTKLELCQEIKKHIPDFEWRIENGRDPDQRDYAVSSARFREATGFSPLIGLSAGIEKLIQTYAMPFGGIGWRGWHNA